MPMTGVHRISQIVTVNTISTATERWQPGARRRA
jgi:hypothetical protein